MNDSSVRINPNTIVQYVQSVWGPMVSGLTDDQLVYVLEAGSVSMPLMGWMNQEIVDATIELQKMFGNEYRHLSLLSLGTPFTHPHHERYRSTIHKELLGLADLLRQPHAPCSIEDANHMVNVLMCVRKTPANLRNRKWSIDELIRLFNDISIQTVSCEVADRFRSDQLCQRLVEGVHSAVMHAAMSVDGFERDEAAAIMANQLLSIADDKDALLRLVGAGISVANDNRRGMRQYFDNEFSNRRVEWKDVLGSLGQFARRHYPGERPAVLQNYLENLPSDLDEFVAEVERSDWCRTLYDDAKGIHLVEDLIKEVADDPGAFKCNSRTISFRALFHHPHQRELLEMIGISRLRQSVSYQRSFYVSAAEAVAAAYEYLFERFPGGPAGRFHPIIRLMITNRVFDELEDLVRNLVITGAHSRNRY